MKKKELRSGMLVKLSSGIIYKVYLNTVNGSDLFVREDGHYKDLRYYNDDLIYESDMGFSIIKVYQPHGVNKLNSFDYERDYSLIYNNNNVSKLSSSRYSLNEIQEAINVLSNVIESISGKDNNQEV